jgi:hypothetical protein
VIMWRFTPFLDWNLGSIITCTALAATRWRLPLEIWFRSMVRPPAAAHHLCDSSLSSFTPPVLAVCVLPRWFDPETALTFTMTPCSLV